MISDYTERFDAKIAKVFWVNDDHANFRAYVVKWKDQEVVVTDDKARTRYNVAEIPTVFVRRGEIAKDEQVLEFKFHIPNLPGDNTLKTTSGGAGDH